MFAVWVETSLFINIKFFYVIVFQGFFVLQVYNFNFTFLETHFSV